jgi:hypothetical protein
MNERIVISALTIDEQQTLDCLLDQLAAKAGRNRLRAAYYDGKNAIRDLGISTPPAMRRIATVLGWSAKACDVLNRRCHLDKIVIPGMDQDSVGVDDLWRQNYLDTEAAHAGLSSLIHSTAFLVTTQGDTLEGEPEVLITAKSALAGTGMWNRRKRALDSFLSVMDTDDDGDGRPVDMVMYLDGLNVTMTKEAGVWKVDRQDHAFGVPVEPLIYKGDLEHPFGRSRISRAVMSLHDSAIRTVIRSEVTAELYSVPQRILLGADESAFKNADGTIKTAWQSILGRIWAIPDDEDAANPRAEIKEYTAASQEPHMAQLRAQAQLFAGETSIPISSLGISTEGNPASAESYYASREDLIMEAEGTTDGWTPAWTRAMIRGLQMLNKWADDEIPPEVLKLQPKWRSPANPSRAAAADAMVKLISVFPWMADSEVALEQVGFDPASIERLLADKRRAGGSAALRAIVAAASAGRPAVTMPALAMPGVVDVGANQGP